jgi:hypothetical protein
VSVNVATSSIVFGSLVHPDGQGAAVADQEPLSYVEFGVVDE